MFNEVTIGSELTLRGPVGKFTLPETIDKDLYLICTGTGIAPFRSMVNFINANAVAHKNIYLVFGCRTMADCLYKDELLQLQSTLPNFNYLPCFSRENELPDWANKGYVHAAYEEKIISK